MQKMAKMLLVGASALAAAAVAQAQPSGANAARATLYELPNYQGRSVTIYDRSDNLANAGFNDTARSAHFDGDWTVCTDAAMRGDCQTLTGDIANLESYGLAGRSSSLQQGVDYCGYGPDTSRRYGDNARANDQDEDRDRGQGYPVNPAPGVARGDNDRGYGDSRGYGDQDRGGYDDRYNRYPPQTTWEGGTPGRSVVFFPRPTNNGQEIAAYDRSAADWFCRRQGLSSAIYYDTSFRSARAWRWNGGGFVTNAPVLRDVLCRR